MKKLLSITALLAVFLISVIQAGNKPLVSKNKLAVSGSDTVTKSFGVSGNAACKATIEGLVTSNAGVLAATWDSTGQVMTVTYVHSIIKKTQLCRLLAAAGYDNDAVRTKDAIYANLPAACQYTRTPLPQ